GLPAGADVAQRTQSVGGIGAPFAVGELCGNRFLEALAVGALAFADARDHRRNLMWEPTMPCLVLGAFTVEVEVEFHSGGAPTMHSAFDHCWRTRVIGPAGGDLRTIADRLDGGKIGLFGRRGISGDAMQHRDAAAFR